MTDRTDSDAQGGIAGSTWRGTDHDDTEPVGDLIEEISADRIDEPVPHESVDNEYTRTGEESYTVLDEENNNSVGSVAGLANKTQNVDANPPAGYHDDAEIREGKLPVQDVGYGGESSESDVDDATQE